MPKSESQTTEFEALLTAADNLFDAYRKKYLTRSTNRLRANAPLRAEMGELKAAFAAMKETARAG